jgi:hypothetical protein
VNAPSAADRNPELCQLTVSGAFLSILPLAAPMLVLGAIGVPV